MRRKHQRPGDWRQPNDIHRFAVCVPGTELDAEPSELGLEHAAVGLDVESGDGTVLENVAAPYEHRGDVYFTRPNLDAQRQDVEREKDDVAENDGTGQRKGESDGAAGLQPDDESDLRDSESQDEPQEDARRISVRLNADGEASARAARLQATAPFAGTGCAVPFAARSPVRRCGRGAT